MTTSSMDDDFRDPAEIPHYETQFSPREDDSQNMWDVVAILAEKNGRYKVQWDGVDPSTKKAWKPSWVTKSDCTDDLIHDWKLKKEQMKKRRKSSAASRRASTTRSSVAPAKSKQADSSRPPDSTATRRSKPTSVVSGVGGAKSVLEVVIPQKRPTRPHESDDEASPPKPRKRRRAESPVAEVQSQESDLPPPPKRRTKQPRVDLMPNADVPSATNNLSNKPRSMTSREQATPSDSEEGSRARQSKRHSREASTLTDRVGSPSRSLRHPSPDLGNQPFEEEETYDHGNLPRANTRSPSLGAQPESTDARQVSPTDRETLNGASAGHHSRRHISPDFLDTPSIVPETEPPTQSSSSLPLKSQKSQSKSRVLKPVPAVTPSKFQSHIPAPDSQIDEFTPTPDEAQAVVPASSSLDVRARGEELARISLQAKTLSRTVPRRSLDEILVPIDPVRTQLPELSSSRIESSWHVGEPAADADMDEIINSSLQNERQPDNFLSQISSPAPVPQSVQPSITEDITPTQITELKDALTSKADEIRALEARVAELQHLLAEPTPANPDLTLAFAQLMQSRSSLRSDFEKLQGTNNDLQAEVAKLIRSKELIQGDLDLISQMYREASSAAAALGDTNRELSQENEILKIKVTTGLEQTTVFWESQVRKLQGELGRSEQLVRVLQRQAELTDDSVRSRAAAEPGLRAELEKMRIQRIVLYERLEQQESCYRCVWFTDRLLRCGQVFETREELRDHVFMAGHLSDGPD